MARTRRQQLGQLDGVYQRLEQRAERDLVFFDGPPHSRDPVLRAQCRRDPNNFAGCLLTNIDAGLPIEVTGADLIVVGEKSEVERSASYRVFADDSVVRLP